MKKFHLIFDKTQKSNKLKSRIRLGRIENKSELEYTSNMNRLIKVNHIPK